MPIGKYPNFAACVADQVKNGKGKEAAKKICGFLEKKLEKSASFIDKVETFRQKAGIGNSTKEKGS